jgi:hypothetical protein
MRKEQVTIGGKYVAKISGKMTVVQIESQHRSGGWTATNTQTGKPVRIRTAGKLRKPATPQPKEKPAKPAKQPAAAKEAEPAQTIALKQGETFAVRSGNEYVIRMVGESVVYAQQLRDGEPAGPTRPFDRASIEAGRPKGTRGEDSYYPKSEALEAAATVLADAPEPLTAKEIMQEILRRKLWYTAGRTPHISLGSALARDLKRHGEASRFERVGRGLFQLRNRHAETAKASQKTPKRTK